MHSTRHATKRITTRLPLPRDLCRSAMMLFPFHPASCAVKLRLLAEAITHDVAARIGVTLTSRFL